MPRGPVCQLSRRVLVNISATSSKSMHAGGLKSESASFRPTTCKRSHLRTTRIGSRGRSLVIFFNTYSSIPNFSASSSTLDTWNRTEPRACVVVPATPSTLVFLLLHGRHRCCAIHSWMNEAEDPESIRALAIVLDQSSAVKFTLQVISSTCSLTVRAST